MITFLLEEEAFDPKCSQRGDDCCRDDLPRLQVGAVRVDMLPALLQIQQHHLLIHLQGTLNTKTRCKMLTVPQMNHHNWVSEHKAVICVIYVCATLLHTWFMFTHTAAHSIKTSQEIYITRHIFHKSQDYLYCVWRSGCFIFCVDKGHHLTPHDTVITKTRTYEVEKLPTMLLVKQRIAYMPLNMLKSITHIPCMLEHT